MNAKEKKILKSELGQFHSEIETWLTDWFKPTANDIIPKLAEKFAAFEKNLSSKLKS